MFCRQCGRKLSDGEKVCSGCGATVQNDAIEQKKIIAPNSIKESYKSKKTINPVLETIIIGVILLIILSTIVKMKKGSSVSAENVALMATKAIVDQNIDKYYELLAPPYEEYMVGSQGWYRTSEEFKKDLLEWDEEKKNSMINNCGKNFKAKYSVDSVDKYEGDDLYSIKRALSNDYYYNMDEIEDAAMVTILIEGSGSEGKSTWTYPNSCVKIKGKWYIHRPGFD